MTNEEEIGFKLGLRHLSDDSLMELLRSFPAVPGDPEGRRPLVDEKYRELVDEEYRRRTKREPFLCGTFFLREEGER